jgi:L-cysteine desulfidase
MDLRSFFEQEVKPALGCTEPGAVALAAATAAGAARIEARAIRLRLSANVFKNGISVGIPGTRGLRGNLMAGALGALCGDPGKGLLVLEKVPDEAVEKALRMVEEKAVTQEVVADVPSVFVEAQIQGEGHSASAVISGRHDRVVEVRVDGEVTRRLLEADTNLKGRPGYLEELQEQEMEELYALAGSIDGPTERFLLDGARMNREVAQRGLEAPWGLGVGYSLATGGDDLLYRIKALAGAAADVRMDGGPWPVMSSAGSGNHGITAILPVSEASEAWGKSERKQAEALALSHLVTGLIKAHTGRLTPTCGCVIAAGAGAAAGIVRLGGGSPQQAERAVASLASSLLGVLCDGAKGSCALKVSAGAGEAYLSARLALEGRGVSDRQGVIAPGLKETARAIAEISRHGMAAVDATVLRLLETREGAAGNQKEIPKQKG